MSDPDIPGSRLSTLQLRTQPVIIPKLELVVMREAGQPTHRRLELEGDLVHIGSHPSNDLALQDPLISRFHCTLERSAAGWTLTDVGSLNGTFIGGVRVRSADLPLPACELQLGDSAVSARELRPTSITEVPLTSSFGELHGESLVMRRLFAQLERVCQSDATVLVEGESGTGKELVATELVSQGARADKPFVIVDCGAISRNLIESELFGHLRGAFTGADRTRLGAFETAQGGTILLDEIGELPLELQPKLLRVLESREIRRVGENTARRVDVRVIAATNRDLAIEVNQGRFREDLFFRLSVVSLRVPPLRYRLDDLPLLIRVILRSMNAEESESLFSRDVLAELARHDWPGNVRELRNYVERTVVFERPGGSRSGFSSYPPGPGNSVPPPSQSSASLAAAGLPNGSQNGGSPTHPSPGLTLGPSSSAFSGPRPPMKSSPTASLGPISSSAPLSAPRPPLKSNPNATLNPSPASSPFSSSRPFRSDVDEDVDLEIPFKLAKEDIIARFEQRYLAELMRWAEGNVSRAARKAKVDRMYLYKLLQRYELHAKMQR